MGCGDGRITAHLAGLVPQGSVLGIDLSPDMVSFAKAHHPQISNLSFQVQDASRLNFRDEFDLVVSFACLHWISDHRPVLAGVRRALKPGGALLCQCGGRGNAAEILSVTQDLAASDRWAPYFQDLAFPYHFYGPEEYSGWLAEAGLKIRQVRLIPKDMVHSGREGLMGFLASTWLPYTERLPPRLRSDFLGEVASRYLQLYPLDREGRSHVRMVRLQVHAQRPSL